MSSFFTKPTQSKKRKSAPTNPTASAPKKSKARPSDDESISGSESDVSSAGARTPTPSESDEEGTTEAGRRLKLAQQYLENVRRDVAEDQELDPGSFDAAEIDKEVISRRLKEDVAEGHGRVYKRIANTISWQAAESAKFSWDGYSTTGVAVDGKGKHVWTASKDGVVCKWELVPLTIASSTNANHERKRRRKPKQIIYRRGGDHRRAGDTHYKHHTAPILCIAASHDGRFVATGGADRRLIIWSGDDLKPLRVFTHHRDAVTALSFMGKTNQLFSASKDRTVKIWSLNELAYVETLFGHQDALLDVDAVGGGQERCVTVGGRDRSARLWKVVEESQLLFRGGGTASMGRLEEDRAVPQGERKQANGEITHVAQFGPPRVPEHSLDRVLQIDTQLFITGSDNGSLSLYSLHKKKALHVFPLAHGYDPPVPASQSLSEADVSERRTNADPTPRYITAIAGIPLSDLFLTGSWDGYIRVWRLGDDLKRIERVGVIGKELVNEKTVFDNDITIENGQQDSVHAEGPLRGVVNDIKLFERGDRGKEGVGVVVAIGKEMRLGSWLQRKAKNGAVYFEIPIQRA